MTLSQLPFQGVRLETPFGYILIADHSDSDTDTPIWASEFRSGKIYGITATDSWKRTHAYARSMVRTANREYQTLVKNSVNPETFDHFNAWDGYRLAQMALIGRTSTNANRKGREL